MRFTINNKHLIKMDVREKNYVRKRLLMIFLTKDEVLMGQRHDQNISVRSLTLSCGGMDINCVVDHNPNTSQ